MAPRKQNLRAVPSPRAAAAKSAPAAAAASPAKRRKPKHTVVTAAASGTRLDLAIAMRDRIARAIEGECSPRDLAALTKRLDDIVEKIEVLRAADDEDDEYDDDVTGGEDDGDDEAFDASTL